MPSNPAITVEAVWLSALRAQGRSPKTLATYEHAVRQLIEWREADPDLSTMTRIEALAFVRHLGERFQPAGGGGMTASSGSSTPRWPMDLLDTST